MTRDELLKAISEGNQIVIDVPMKVATHWTDTKAAEMLKWLFDNVPAETTWREAHDILDAAKWWITLIEATREETQ